MDYRAQAATANEFWKRFRHLWREHRLARGLLPLTAVVICWLVFHHSAPDVPPLRPEVRDLFDRMQSLEAQVRAGQMPTPNDPLITQLDTRIDAAKAAYPDAASTDGAALAALAGYRSDLDTLIGMKAHIVPDGASMREGLDKSMDGEKRAVAAYLQAGGRTTH